MRAVDVKATGVPSPLGGHGKWYRFINGTKQVYLLRLDLFTPEAFADLLSFPEYFSIMGLEKRSFGKCFYEDERRLLFIVALQHS
jgi:hypothetical protein